MVSGAKASILEAPENVRVSKDGHIHWIPTKPQLGQNPITIEINEEKQTLLYSINVFVNAPPVISFRPDDTVYVNLNENFSFTLKSFEENENQPVFWSLKDGPEKMIFKSGELSWDATAPDIHPYTIELTDTLDSDIFYGTLYVNDTPKIISVPPKYVNLGETYIYNITVKDANTLSPQGKINNPILFLKNGPTGMKLENNKIEWTPRLDQIGASPVNIEVFDKVQKTEQDFIVYVNDVPKIISTDSLRIAVGDTLHHFVRAQDANEVTDLSYGINADLDNLLMNPKTGEIVWTPTEKDLGYNSIQVSVSDQFDSLGKDSQTLTILVYKNPSFIDIVFPEAYAGVEYVHDIKAENMNKQNIPGKDVFVNMVETTFQEARFDTLTHTFVALPTLDEMGVQSATFILEDSYLNQITETFPIKVLTSPCETIDTTYIASSDDETIERSSTLTKTNYYKKEKSILEKTGLLKEESPPVQYVEIAEINKTEIIDTVFLEKEDINKYLPHLAKVLGNKSTSNKLSKKDLRKIKKIQRKKEKAAKKQKREKPQITFNRNKQETEYNDNISFKPAPKELPEKVDLHKIKNETIRKTILAVLETPADKAKDIKEEETSPPPIDLGHNIRGDKTHITKNKWVQNKEKNADGRIQLNYDELFYYPGEEFNYKANYWDGYTGQPKEVK